MSEQLYPELEEIREDPRLTPADNALMRAIVGAGESHRVSIPGGSNLKNFVDGITARLTDQGYDIVDLNQ